MGDNISFKPLLEPAGTPWRCFGLSFAVQAIAVAGALTLALLQPPDVISIAHLQRIELIATPPLNTTPAPPPPDNIRVRPLPVRRMPELTTPPDVQAPPALPVRSVAAKFETPAAVPPPPRVVRPVDVGVFTSTGSAAPPTSNLRAREVQTGGFGDPNGLPASATGAARANVAVMGSFDLPAGPGQGNGTGGARGARATVVSTGFGNGVALQPAVQVAPKRVLSAGFTATETVAAVRKPRPVTASAVRPVQITAKPAPVYTEEARRLRVEGEVLLEVVFAASGELRVVRVVRGLGYGLDEAAIRAARQMRFTPAVRDGQPIDFEARLHIVFQLS